MPCNTDYMMPTHGEINRLHGKELELKGVADEMVFAADVIRDVLLENKGKITSTTGALAVGQVGKYAGSTPDLIARGDAILAEMHKEYAYGQTPTPIVDVYLKVKDQLSYISEIADRFIAGKKIYVTEYKNVEKQQILHRQGDIKRLIEVFNASGNWNMLKKVINVDFTKPLEPQLGFSPDDY